MADFAPKVIALEHIELVGLPVIDGVPTVANDNVLAAGQTSGQPGGQDPYRELVEELRDRVRSLEESNRENRRIIAGLIQRVPELEPAREDEPQEATQEPQGGQERAPEGQDASGTRAGREEATRAPWWRRWFGS